MADSNIQKIANQIVKAAETEMDQVMANEADHGKCYNYRKSGEKDIWMFEDGHQIKIQQADAK